MQAPVPEERRSTVGAVVRNAGWLILVFGALAIGGAAIWDSPWQVVRPLEPVDALALIEGGEAPPDVQLVFPAIDRHRATWLEAAAVRIGFADGWLERVPDEGGDAPGAGDVIDTSGDLSLEQLLAHSQQVAVIAAAWHLGRPVAANGDGVRVWAVVAGDESPLEIGDVVVEVAGDRTPTVVDAATVLGRFRPGDRPDVTLADGTVHRITIGQSAEQDADEARRVAAALGVAIVETEDLRVTEPEVSWRQPDDVGGASGSLAMAVAAWQELDGGDLAPGRYMVTGEVGPHGSVFIVDEMPAKAQQAAALGVDLLIVPEEQQDAAREHADGVEVIGVSSLGEALEALS